MESVLLFSPWELRFAAAEAAGGTQADVFAGSWIFGPFLSNIHGCPSNLLSTSAKAAAAPRSFSEDGWRSSKRTFTSRRRKPTKVVAGNALGSSAASRKTFVKRENSRNLPVGINLLLADDLSCDANPV